MHIPSLAKALAVLAACGLVAARGGGGSGSGQGSSPGSGGGGGGGGGGGLLHGSSDGHDEKDVKRQRSRGCVLEAAGFKAEFAGESGGFKVWLRQPANDSSSTGAAANASNTSVTDDSGGGGGEIEEDTLPLASDFIFVKYRGLFETADGAPLSGGGDDLSSLTGGDSGGSTGGDDHRRRALSGGSHPSVWRFTGGGSPGALTLTCGSFEAPAAPGSNTTVTVLYVSATGINPNGASLALDSLLPLSDVTLTLPLLPPDAGLSGGGAAVGYPPLPTLVATESTNASDPAVLPLQLRGGILKTLLRVTGWPFASPSNNLALALQVSRGGKDDALPREGRAEAEADSTSVSSVSSGGGGKGGRKKRERVSLLMGVPPPGGAEPTTGSRAALLDLEGYAFVDGNGTSAVPAAITNKGNVYVVALPAFTHGLVWDPTLQSVTMTSGAAAAAAGVALALAAAAAAVLVAGAAEEDEEGGEGAHRE